MRSPRTWLISLLLLLLPRPAGAQQPLIENYLSHLPPTPRIVGETTASARLALFGDPTHPDYRDADPRDGVDDRRGERLLQLGEHFSPILRRNTTHLPREVESFFGDHVLLHVDTWRDGERIESSTIDLGPRLRQATDPAAGEESGYLSAIAPDDAPLSTLLRDLSPRLPRPAVLAPEGEAETVLYIDLPGNDEASWKREHRRREQARSRIYVHPFIHDHGEAAGEARYQLILQYWFFYPYNDGANNHEGDWEHLNVSITTSRRAREHDTSPHQHGMLSEADLAAILGPVDPLPLDSLRIRSVAYYFHNNVMMLDYLAIAAGEPVAFHAKSSDGAVHVWEDTLYMESAVRRRLSLAGGRLASHPIGYIGGNNKGMDELLQFRPRFLGSYNRDSHGTYPFPGVWRKVGPLDATEKIYGGVVPAVRPDAPTAPVPWYELITDHRYLVYRASDLVLLPDWERLLPLMLQDPEMRRRWLWLVLPVHLGFPAVPSPGAGALNRVDLGNVAPMGPAYNSAWNRPGPTSVYREYTPTVLRVALAPISPLSSLQSGWGVLNYPLVLWGLMPGGNVAVTQLLPWTTGAMHVLGAPPAKTLFLGELPTRFTSIGGGVYRQFGGQDFARLLPGVGDPEVDQLLSRFSGQNPRLGERVRARDWGQRVWLNLYYGSRVSIENTFSLGTAEVSYPIADAAGRTLTTVGGTLETRELTGGLTYRLPPASSDLLRLYVRTGYAWTAYTVQGISIGSRTPAEAERSGGYMLSLLPSRRWWPNSFYGGLGLEVFSPPRYWLLRRLGYGLRLELTGVLHRLDADSACADCHVTAERGDVAALLLFAW